MLLVLTLPAAAQVKGPASPEILTPAGQLRLVAHDLATRAQPADAPFYRYLSFITLPGEKAVDLPTFRRVFRFALNHVNGSRGLVREYEVPGSAGTLVRIDIRDAVNWTRAAWEVVGNRDYLFREPWLPHRETEFVRLATGVKQDPKTLAAVSLLNAYQLFRELIESQRVDGKGLVSTYYDLLYAAERHPDGDLAFVVVPKPGDVGPAPVEPETHSWPGGVWEQDGKFYAPGSFTYKRKAEVEKYEKALAQWQAAKEAAAQESGVVPRVAAAGKGDKNFPAKGADFEKRWGGDVDAADLKRFLVDPRFGGIAVGGENDPKAGSFVALNDRVVRLTASKLVQGGWVGRTFDVTENTGDRDHLERLDKIAQGIIAADAGELLATLPNGAQAGLLVNGQDERVEIAATNVAQIRGGKIDKYSDVRTQMSCIVCHAPNGGYIPYANAVEESIKRGLEARAIDPVLAQKVRDFNKNLERETRGLQEKYAFYIQDTTATRDEPKGWTPATTVKQFQAARDWYDLPVTLETAAREFGVPKKELQTLLLDLSQGKGLRESVRTRVNQLATDQSIPRRTWEVDVAKEIGLILDSVVGKEEPLKELISQQLLEDAYKRFGKGVRK